MAAVQIFKFKIQMVVTLLATKTELIPRKQTSKGSLHGWYPVMPLVPKKKKKRAKFPSSKLLLPLSCDFFIIILFFMVPLPLYTSNINFYFSGKFKIRMTSGENFQFSGFLEHSGISVFVGVSHFS